MEPTGPYTGCVFGHNVRFLVKPALQVIVGIGKAKGFEQTVNLIQIIQPAF